jgi:hypothetical protein
MQGDGLPRASAVQELVTAWKVLWSWTRRRPVRAKAAETNFM